MIKDKGNIMKCTATCSFGLESVLAAELKKMDFENIASENGRVNFQSDLTGIAKANINLRTAERVYIELANFNATNFDELFEKTEKTQFYSFIDKYGAIIVNVSSVSSMLKSIPDCQSIVKKAIIKSMSYYYKMERFPETGPKYPINVFILKDNVRIYLDTSGSSLHKRGYRKKGGEAPLKETLASAIVQISYWNKDKILIDPFCGSGTILIEAAMIAKNIAPGLYREFIAEKWPIFKNKEWDKTREYFESKIINDNIQKMYGSDMDKDMISIARQNARSARVSEIIEFSVKDFKDIVSLSEKGIIICNPPYGERLEDQQIAKRIYSDMNIKFKEFPKWSKYILAPDKIFEEAYVTKADKKRKLYNGKILCNLYQYFGSK
jgi:putative N6-adenine-specific DNA methylase